ncbi:MULTISPECIES: AMP-binding protein [unclassified Chelatococcus]|uniref:AMP-binding protein n=1 Tax=unclassified Chelatococcus TaxID=2638111 RepID=UPI001BCF8E2F|nr:MULTISPECIES: AMP-binding protein [unclassified Chelatococcus]MBS7700232.1 AMP-binding protein [Chelatococcus sp. YT9]MBX3558203.1 AMP-binding protein [Chelatococcus sp.]
MSVLTYPHYNPAFPRDMWVLPRILEHQAEIRADRPCLSWTDAGEPLSFAEANAEVNRLAHGLAAAGIGKGDMVVLYMPNSLEFVLLWWALQKLGAVEVPVGDIQKGTFLAHQLNLSKAATIITTAPLLQRLAEVEESVPHLKRCYLLDENTTDVRLRRVEIRSAAELKTDNTSNPGIYVDPRDLAAILYTSGTTGMSKGVEMPHSQFYFFAEEDVQLVGLTDQDVYMTGFPFFHGNAQFLTIYPCLIAGAHCVLYPKFSASDYFGRARRCGATVANLLGATMAFICATPPQPEERNHRLRTIYAAPLAFDLAEQFTDRFGPIEFVDGFGQTEISNVFQTPRGAKRPEGASGVLMDQWYEVRIADPETDEPVPEGEIGELLIRHKVPGIISNGYLGQPDKTVETWRNLWFHTGDALRRDAEGWYYFVDRVKDALRRRGENISSFEVESVIRTFNGVAEVAVIGVKADEKAGEDEVKACIVLRAGATLDHAALIAWCDERMAAHMVPRYIEVMDSLPQTPSEKVKKKELRERGITPETWDRTKAGVSLASEGRVSRRA